ncbi:LON peptidase substrate-binding domain-containing protein [Parasalinivibrio latis]|uniref:LON peptidase substrate-binding domain-containing protein n=1 Tax=Parasalinivibrio latis TaxID=2952610 RepID=UPI0030E4BE39
MLYGLFPLPIFLLPGGITKLRIFEPRYIRLVKESLASQSRFVLAMTEGETICSYGTLVDIIDFETLEDGLLGITIQGRHRVRITSASQQSDKLWVSGLDILSDWAEEKSTGDCEDITNGLRQVFTAYPNHGHQYEATHFDSITWVCQRWLEVLPLANNQRQWFIAQNSVAEAKDFIRHLIYKSD